MASETEERFFRYTPPTDQGSQPGLAQSEGNAPESPTPNNRQAQRLQAREVAGAPSSAQHANANALFLTGVCAAPRPEHKQGEVRKTVTPEDPYCVNGTPYLDAEQIPGNEPMPLVDDCGANVMGPNGQMLIGPSRGVSIAKDIANEVDGTLTPIGRQLELLKFRQAGEWDFQRMKDDDGSIIFTSEYTDFSNVIIGYADANGVFPSTEMEANLYAKIFSRFKNEKMSSDYTGLPERIVQDYKIGQELRKNLPPKQNSAPICVRKK